MKNVSHIFLLCLVLLCNGCSQQAEKETKNEVALIGESDSIVSMTEEAFPTIEDIVKEDLEKRNLTMEQVEIFSTQETLTLQDLMGWEGLQESSLEAAEWNQYYYDFVFKDREYRLEFRSGKDDELLFVRLVDMQSMLNIDIRTGDVENLIANQVSMKDYLSFTLPEGISQGQYDLYMGHFGGTELEQIDSQGAEICGGIYILDGSRVNPNIVDGELKSVNEYDNNITHEKMESLSLAAAPALLTLMKVEADDGSVTEFYSIYFAKESCFYCYNVRLRVDLFSKEDVLAVAESLQFSERAFNR